MISRLSDKGRQRASVVVCVCMAALLLGLPTAVVAQTSAVDKPMDARQTPAILVSGIVAPAAERVHPSQVATPSRRARMVVGGSVLGAIAGGYLGYRIGKTDLCVTSLGGCPANNDRENMLKGGIVGAATGGIAGLLLSQLSTARH